MRKLLTLVLFCIIFINYFQAQNNVNGLKQDFHEKQDIARNILNNRDNPQSQYTADGSLIVDDDNAPYIGPENADIVLVLFFDFYCGYCHKLTPHIQTVIKDNPDVKIIFKPATFISPLSDYAARASIAAFRQGRFFVFFDAMMKHITPSSKQEIDFLAQELHFDMELYRQYINDADTTKIINHTKKQMNTLHTNAVPTLFLNNSQIQASTSQQIQMQIDRIRNKIISSAKENKSESPSDNDDEQAETKEYTEGMLRCQKNNFDLPFSCHDRNKNGITGIVRKYHKNGNLFYQAEFKNGKAHGRTRSYYPNGKIHLDIPYVNGSIHGKMKIYNLYEKLISRDTYIYGVEQQSF